MLAMTGNGSLQLKFLSIQVLTLGALLFGLGCASGVLQYEEVEKLEINEEYDKMIKVKEIEPAPGETARLEPVPEDKTPIKKKPKEKIKRK